MKGVQEAESVAINLIRLDGGTQARENIDQATVDSYKSSMEDLVGFPPLIVFKEGESMWLADGWHRLHAAMACGNDHIACDVREGTLSDAILYAAGANKLHGLRRTNADKRRAVEMVLGCEKWAGRSDRWIADQVGVNDHTVAKVRNCVIYAVDTPRIGVDGKTRKVPSREPQVNPPAVTDYANAADSVIDKKEEPVAFAVVDDDGSHEDDDLDPAWVRRSEICNSVQRPTDIRDFDRSGLSKDAIQNEKLRREQLSKDEEKIGLTFNSHIAIERLSYLSTEEFSYILPFIEQMIAAHKSGV